MTLMIEPEDHPNWSVDSLYAVHLSVTFMTLGQGATYTTSCKWKLNGSLWKPD